MIRINQLKLSVGHTKADMKKKAGKDDEDTGG